MFRGEVEPYMKSVEELTAVVQFLKSANPKWDLETVRFTGSCHSLLRAMLREIPKQREGD